MAVSNSAVNSTLIQDKLGAQHLVFYTSKALLNARNQYNLFYRSKTAIKAQVLVYFVVEFTPTAKEEKLVTKNKENSKVDNTSFADADMPKDMWQLRVDEASNHNGAGAGVVIITPNGTLLEQTITLGLPTSNNEAEYEPLLAELSLGKELLIKKLAIYSNS
ncbi:unnamed protein product [Prunus armeniaca]